MKKEKIIKSGEVPKEVQAVHEMIQSMTIAGDEAVNNLVQNGQAMARALEKLSTHLRESASVLYKVLNTEGENALDERENKPLELWLNSDCEMVDEHFVFGFNPSPIPSEHYYHEDAYLELKEKYDKLIKGVELMMARCGLKDPGDACRAVIKTGKELFETVGHTY